MNTSRIRLFVLVAASFLSAPFARADAISYAKLLAERDAVLSRIVVLREGQFANGTKDDGAVVSARVALWSFRRDISASKPEKIKQQELIVAVYQDRLDDQKARVKAGVADPEDILLATNSLLEARQLLEELKFSLRKG
jgi:hypothetical protein